MAKIFKLLFLPETRQNASLGAVTDAGLAQSLKCDD